MFVSSLLMGEVYRGRRALSRVQPRAGAPPPAKSGSAGTITIAERPLDRALVLADAAADAAARDHLRSREPARAAVGPRDHAVALEHDGLVGHGAHLLADDARRAGGPRQAAVPVDDGDADDLLALRSAGRRRDRPRGADLATGVAGVVAVAEARPQHRRPEPLEARLRQRGLEAGGRAGLHALAAAQAAREEAAFVLGARRSDQARPLDRSRARRSRAGERRPPRPPPRGRPRGGRGRTPPTARVGPVPASCRSRVGQATRQSRHIVHSEVMTRAGAAPLAPPLRPPTSIASSSAGGGAGAAGAAAVAHDRAQQLDLGDEAEQRPERAEIPAPEAVGDRIEQDHGEEQEEQRDPLLVAWLDGRQHGCRGRSTRPTARRRPSDPRSCPRVPGRRRGRRSRG